MSKWLLIGSGPSSETLPLLDGYSIATVNARVKLKDIPRDAIDLYGVFEITAAKELKSYLTYFRDHGKTKVVTRPWLTNTPEHPNVVALPEYWGPESLKHLHDEVRFAPTPEGQPEYGQNMSWISSGVLMLWYILETQSPESVTVLGLDGYKIGSDYANGLADLCTDINTQAIRRAEMNKRMAEGIKLISNYYTKSTIRFPVKPNHYDKSWRVETTN